MNSKIIITIFSLVLVLSSCKGTKTASTGSIKSLSADKIIANHYNKAFNFKTLNARLKVSYDDGRQSVSPTVTLRIKKDEVIWLSAKVLGITVAKAMITPEKVSYYEKINSTYFDGSFKMIEEWLGTELDFYKVQQMLIGQSLFNLRDEKFKSEVVNQSYQLTPKKELEIFERLLFINPSNFRISQQGIRQSIENRNLLINYPKYQKVGNQDFPEEIFIKANQNDEGTTIKIEYKDVDYNADVSFPFKIPSGYEEVTIK